MGSVGKYCAARFGKPSWRDTQKIVNLPETGLTEVYPVGLQRSIWLASRLVRSGKFRLAWAELAQELTRELGLLQTGNWRSVKLALNGHLAEPREWPSGMRRCGTGWTKKRAIRATQKAYWDRG